MEISQYLPFWSKLTRVQQEQILNVMEIRSVKKGTRIHDSSEECLGLVILKQGQLRAYILSEDGREITIGRLFDYDVSLLSASCVMPDLQFNIMIEAEKDTQFWSIPACLFKNLVEESLAMSNYARSLISSNLSELMWLMEQIMWKAGCLPFGGNRHRRNTGAENHPREDRRPHGNRPGGGHPDAALFPERGHGAPDPGHHRNHRRSKTGSAEWLKNKLQRKTRIRPDSGFPCL